MRNSLEIDEMQTWGFVVRITSVDDDDDVTYDEYAFEHTPGVLAKVLHWLGYEDQIDEVLSILDDEEKEYALSDLLDPLKPNP